MNNIISELRAILNEGRGVEEGKIVLDLKRPKIPKFLKQGKNKISVNSKVWNHVTQNKIKDKKDWIERWRKNPDFMSGFSGMSIQMGKDHLYKSVQELVEKAYLSFRHRAHAMGKYYGDPAPIDPKANKEWIAIAGALEGE